MKKTIGIIILGFVLGNGYASIPPLEILNTSLPRKVGHGSYRIKEIPGTEIRILKSWQPEKENRPDLHNKGILELKPDWFPKQSISKKGERTYYYWEF